MSGERGVIEMVEVVLFRWKSSCIFVIALRPVHVPRLVEDKRWNQDKWSPRKLLANVGSPNKSALTYLH